MMRGAGLLASTLLLAGCMETASSPAVTRIDLPAQSLDGLYRVESGRFDGVYRRADVDLRRYHAIAIAPPQIRFTPASGSAIEGTTLRQAMAGFLAEELARRLAPQRPLSTRTDRDVVIAAVTIQDIVMTTGADGQRVLDGTQAILTVELRDAVTGATLARFGERREIRRLGNQWPVTTEAGLSEARALAGLWAQPAAEIITFATFGLGELAMTAP